MRVPIRARRNQSFVHKAPSRVGEPVLGADGVMRISFTRLVAPSNSAICDYKVTAAPCSSPHRRVDGCCSIPRFIQRPAGTSFAKEAQMQSLAAPTRTAQISESGTVRGIRDVKNVASEAHRRLFDRLHHDWTITPAINDPDGARPYCYH